MKRWVVTVSLVFTILTMTTPSQLYASPTTEDDGWIEGDYEGSLEEQEEQAQEDWEDAGRPGENNNDDDDNNNPNPYCDKVSDEYIQSGGVCHDRLDYDQETGLYPCNDGTQAVDWRDCEDVSVSNDDESRPNSNNIPECVNGVTQECVISAIGLICRPGYDLSNPNIVGGGHACQDIYAGIAKPQPQPESESNLKNCGDGIVAVSCGVGRYWCPGGDTGESFHTNDWRDCEDAIEKHHSNNSTRSYESPVKNAPNNLAECPDGYHRIEDGKTEECIDDKMPCPHGYIKTENGDYCEDMSEECKQDGGLKECKREAFNQIEYCKKNPLMKECYKNENTILSASKLATVNTDDVDISNCRLDGSADGIQQKFDIATYQACKLHTNNDKIYYDGFVAGCMQVGNTKLICETVADSSILNLGTQSIETTETHPTQAVQPTAIN